MNNLKLNTSKLALDLLEIMFISASVVILTFLFLAQPLIVTGDSMEPEFHDGEQIVVEKISIKQKNPVRDEIIIVKHPENPNVFIIKKLFGIPGDTIKFSKDIVYVNDQVIYKENAEETNLTEIKLADNQYFVMGINSKVSIDSRTWGPIEKDDIVGRVFVVYYPLKSFRFVQ